MRWLSTRAASALTPTVKALMTARVHAEWDHVQRCGRQAGGKGGGARCCVWVCADVRAAACVMWLVAVCQGV